MNPTPVPASRAETNNISRTNRTPKIALTVLILLTTTLPAYAATAIPLIVNMSESTIVNTTGGTPLIAVDVGGNTRYATYTSGSGTNALTFTLSPTVGDIDLDGVTVTSPIDLNGGTIKDSAGNNAALTFTPPNTSGIKVDYPSLSMDFINNDYILSGTHYNTLTSFLSAAGGSFTRASTATYIDSSGTLQTAASGTPRFDYNPVTHVAKGILIEESRTNYAYPYKQVNGFYSYANATSSGLTAPDGSSIAEVNTFDQASGARIFRDTNPGPGNQIYSISVWLKLPAGSSITQARLNLKDYQTDNVRGQSSFISLSTSSWTRLTASGTTVGTTPGLRMEIEVNAYGASAKMLIWGNQIEVGVPVTSDIPTTTAAVTRDADVLTMPTGSWFNSSVGSLSTQSIMPYVGGNVYPRTISLSDGGPSNYMTLYIADAVTDEKRAQISSGGVVSFDSIFTPYVQGNVLRQGLAYQANNSIAAMDGVLGTQDNTVTIPTVNLLAVGSYNSSLSRYLNGDIQTVKYYPLRASNTQLQLLTQ